jgi:hypothetical protein
VRKSLLVVNETELMALWNALQQLVDNTDEDCLPRDVKTAEAAQRLIDRIEADLIPAMEGTVG